MEGMVGIAAGRCEEGGATRVKSRVERIGRILAQALVSDEPPVSDDVEDFMRIAMELTDINIRYLRELFRIQGEHLETQEHIGRYAAFRMWESGGMGNENQS